MCECVVSVSATQLVGPFRGTFVVQKWTEKNLKLQHQQFLPLN